MVRIIWCWRAARGCEWDREVLRGAAPCSSAGTGTCTFPSYNGSAPLKSVAAFEGLRIKHSPSSCSQIFPGHGLTIPVGEPFASLSQGQRLERKNSGTCGTGMDGLIRRALARTKSRLFTGKWPSLEAVGGCRCPSHPAALAAAGPGCCGLG